MFMVRLSVMIDREEGQAMMCRDIELPFAPLPCLLRRLTLGQSCSPRHPVTPSPCPS